MLRADNADLRVPPAARAAGLIDDERWRLFVERRDRVRSAKQRLDGAWVSVDGGRVPGSEWLRRPGSSLEGKELVPVVGDLGLSSLDVRVLEADCRYAGYVARERRDLERVAETERLSLEGVAIDTLPGLSAEVRARLAKVRPETVGQASRVPGVTPAAVALLARLARRRAGGAAAQEGTGVS